MLGKITATVKSVFVEMLGHLADTIGRGGYVLEGGVWHLPARNPPLAGAAPIETLPAGRIHPPLPSLFLPERAMISPLGAFLLRRDWEMCRGLFSLFSSHNFS